MATRRLMIVVDLDLDPSSTEYTAEQMAENLFTSWGEYTYLGKIVETKWLSVMSTLMNKNDLANLLCEESWSGRWNPLKHGNIRPLAEHTAQVIHTAGYEIVK